MWTVFLSVICTFVAYWVGAAIEISPGINFPGFGNALAVITMGGFIMFQLKRVKR